MTKEEVYTIIDNLIDNAPDSLKNHRGRVLVVSSDMAVHLEGDEYRGWKIGVLPENRTCALVSVIRNLWHHALDIVWIGNILCK